MTDASKQFTIVWRDSEREPRCAPDPAYPSGKDIDASTGLHQSCIVDVPYPARRCGIYLIKCLLCEISVAVTTAGRPDDPKSVRFDCKERSEP